MSEKMSATSAAMTDIWTVLRWGRKDEWSARFITSLVP
jgi:hypothetical protein